MLIPECLDCGLVMTNDSMKKSKLLAHQLLKHPCFVGKRPSYFEKKVELRKNNAPKPLEFFVNRASESSIKTQRASCAVSVLVAR